MTVQGDGTDKGRDGHSQSVFTEEIHKADFLLSIHNNLCFRLFHLMLSFVLLNVFDKTRQPSAMLLAKFLLEKYGFEYYWIDYL